MWVLVMASGNFCVPGKWRYAFVYFPIEYIISFFSFIVVPDELITKALAERLGHLDAVKRGWVLHGFPTTRNQVDTLTNMGYEANRVIVLDLPNETSVERLSLRAVDPETGERYYF